MKKLIAVLITSALLAPAPHVASAAIRVNLSAGQAAAQGSAAGAGILKINASIANPSLSQLKVGGLNSTLSGIHLPRVQINSAVA
ncbi:MAG: hypothetical protein V3S11_06935, partial [Elusimicrobiota bacterium]